MEIFKYFEFISLPILGGFTFILFRRLKNYDLFSNSLSMSIHFIEDNFTKFIFFSIFFLKSLFGFLFSLYIINHFHLGFNSLYFLIAVLNATFFLFAIYFTEKRSRKIHRIFVYTSGLLWIVSLILIANIIQSQFLQIIGFILIFIIISSAFLFSLFTKGKRINFIYQAIVIIIIWIYITLITISI